MKNAPRPFPSLQSHIRSLLAVFLLALGVGEVQGQIYQHDFGTTTITGTTYSVAPTVLDANLSDSSWATTAAAFTSFAGSSGQALSINNSGGTPTYTLTFTVASGYEANITGLSFWRQRSTSGAQNYSVTINGGSPVATGTVPTSGANTGALSVAGKSGLTGTVTVVIALSGASGSGTFRLDDFTLTGTVAIPTPPTISTTGSPAAQTTAVGSASTPPAQFSVSGVSLTAGITVTPPAGFEVSTSSSSGYSSSSILVGAAGTVSPTTVYIRLAAATAVGSYSGNIALTSPGADTVNVAMPASTVSATAVPSIGTTGTPSALSSTYGSASASTSFQISGTDMTAGVLVTPSAGFEVSSDDSTFQSTVTVGAAGAFGPVSLYVRLKDNQPAGLVTGGTLTLTSSGANNVVVDIPESEVAKKALTVTGINTPVKLYDGGTNFSPVTGGTLVGVVGTEDVVLGGTPVGVFASSGVADGIGVTISGYTLSGTAASNYTLTQPGPVLGNIQPGTITITAHNVSKIPGDVLTGGAGSSDFAVTGLAPGDTVGTVTITYGAAGLAGASAGTYAGQVTPSDATGGSYNPANYNALVYNSGSIFVNAAFTAGNVVVEQIGDGAASLSGSAFPVSVLEFTPAGTLAQTVAMATSGSFRLTDSGNSGSHGYLNTNGAYLAVPGYNSAVGTAGVASLNTKVTHILGTPTGVDTRIEYPASGTVPFQNSDLRSAVPVGDSTFYATGSSTGVWYYNGTDFVQISTTVANTRNVEIFNGSLYFSTGSGSTGIYKVGTGLPTATGATATLLLASPSPYGFALSPDGLTAYVADDSSDVNGGGIRKYTYNSGTTTWSLAYVFSSGVTDVGVRGLAVDFTGPNPVIYAVTEESSGNRLIKVTDTGSGSTVSTIATAPANCVYRGVDFTPVEAAPGAPEIQLYSNDLSANIANGNSINIGNQPAGVQNFSFALKNTGTAPLTLGTVGVTASTNASVNFTAQPVGTVAAAGSGTLTFGVTPTSTGEWSVTLSVVTNDADENPTTWTVSGNARTPFQSWTDGINWNGGDSSAGGDPNGDGLTNLQSYALDIDPVAPSGKRAKLLSGTDTVTAGGPWFTLTYRRSLTATGVSIGIQAANDLATLPVDLTIDGVNAAQEVANPDVDGDGSAELVRIRVKIPAGTGKRFFSLRVSES